MVVASALGLIKDLLASTLALVGLQTTSNSIGGIGGRLIDLVLGGLGGVRGELLLGL